MVERGVDEVLARERRERRDGRDEQAGLKWLKGAGSGIKSAELAAIISVAAVASAALLPLFAGENLYLLRLAGNVGIYVMLAIGLNVVTGYAGLFDMGYVAFYGVGAYVYALLASPQLGVHLPFLAAMPAAVLATVLLGALVCLPTLRLRGDYLAIVTLSFGEIVRAFFNNLDKPVNITNGPNGIVGVDPPAFFGIQVWDLIGRYYVVWILAAVVFVAARLLERGRTGRAWAAIRDDVVAAGALGIHVNRYKLLAFMWGAGVAGLAGANFAAWQGAVFPQNFGMAELVTVFCMVVLGGAGNAAGVVLGAGVVAVLPEVLRGYSVYRMIIYGVALIAIIRYRPQGLLPAPKRSVGQVAGSGDADRVGRAERAGRAGRTEHLCALEAERVGISFGGVRAVDDVSFQVRTGEVFGIIGPNGAGKTTLLNIVSGLARPDAGKVTLFGREITGLRPDLVNRMGMGRTFQNIRLFPRIGVGDNLLAGCHNRYQSGGWRAASRGSRGSGETERDVQRDVWDSLRLVGLSEIGDTTDVLALSYADRRKLEVARAILTGARVLLLDEPAAGMTGAEVEALAGQIRTLKAAGFTIILIEHHIDLVMGVCDRVMVMDHGHKLAEGSPEQVRRDPAVRTAYIGETPEGGRTLARARARGATDIGTGAVKTGGDGRRPEPLLKLGAVSAGYGPVRVLQNVDLEVGRGELVSLIGSNAAGKSTLLRTILGLVPLKQGAIEFDGRRIDGLATEAVVRAGISVVPEGRRVFGRLSVAENLATAYHGAGREDADTLELVFTLFPALAARRFQKAGTLSGGEQQMLVIGRALIARPKLILMDEPSMGLAPIMVERVLDAIVKIRDLGTGILLVEQNAQAALSVADWAYVLRRGEILQTGPAATLGGDGDGDNDVSQAYLQAYLGESRGKDAAGKVAAFDNEEGAV